MQITDEQHDGWERVVSFQDSDFHCFIAIHSTVLGPALGGCRVMPYAHPDDAKRDALRLSKAMTYKSSITGLNLGGGKCVVIAEHATPEIMRKVGEAINHFGGDYVSAEDIGTTLADIAIAGEVTPHINRIDGSLMTARGVLAGIKAAVQYRGYDLSNTSIWVEGLGKVGMPLAKALAKHSKLMVSDLQLERVNEACAAGAEEKLDESYFATLYAPCAKGQVIHAGNVQAPFCDIICGAANNQLADDSYADILHQNGVLFCPDFLINAGGVITSACEIEAPFDQKRCEEMTDGIGTRLLDILELADHAKVTPLAMAKHLAETRLRDRRG